MRTDGKFQDLTIEPQLLPVEVGGMINGEYERPDVVHRANAWLFELKCKLMHHWAAIAILTL
jgi:hypothetical protein